MSSDFPTNDSVVEIVRKCNAIQEGHYSFTGEYHSNIKIATYLVFSRPKYTNIVGKTIFDRFRNDGVTFVLTPNRIEGYLLAHNVAERFNADVAYVIREKDQLFFPEIQIEPTEKILIVDDGLNTGNSLKSLVLLIREQIRAEIVGAGIFVNRYIGDIKKDFSDTRVEAVVSFPEYRIFRLSECGGRKCPYCREYEAVVTELKELSRDGEERTTRYFSLMKKKLSLEIKPAYE